MSLPAALAALVLLAPAASAATPTVTATSGTVQAKGAQATVIYAVTCDAGAFLDLTTSIAQRGSSKALVEGTTYTRVPCTGEPQEVTHAYRPTGGVWKKGEAAWTATYSGINPEGGAIENGYVSGTVALK
jgi:hypothetical protein